MIGIGKWGCKLDTFFYRGEARVTVSDRDGEYAFEAELPGFDLPAYEVKSVEEKGDDTLEVTVLIPALNREISGSVTFDGDSFTGTIKVPLFGKIKLRNGYRISETEQ